MRVKTSVKWKLAWVCLLILFLIVLQSPFSLTFSERTLNAADADDRSVIRVSANFVLVPVSVIDAAGHATPNLTIEDFIIAEDGNPVSISKVADAGQSPLNLILILDLSGSLGSRFEFEQQAATRFLEKVWKQGDAISIISFSEKPEIRLRNADLLSNALQVLQELQPTQEATAFFDAVTSSACMLWKSATPETRQAVIVLSDGSDNRSDAGLADALGAIQRSDTIFYSINPSGASVRLNAINLRGQENLTRMAIATGGTAFVSDKASDLDHIFSTIAGELRAQYLLGYYSSNAHFDGKFRQIAVSIPQRPDLKIHARKGYYATYR
jgi:Ca-activated chloride channel homolog